MDGRPSASELERFLLGTLPQADTARVAEWVSTAPEAAETLRGLAPSDTFVDSLKSAVRSAGPPPQTLPVSPPRTVTHISTPTTAVPGTFPPTELAGFRIVRELGRGGMGAVFEALDTALGRKVALKVMLPAIASDPQARGRFLREARAAARVESDYIVPIYQVGEANGVPFIAMPLLSGETLDTRLKGRRPLPLTEVLALGRHMAEALALAHSAGLIHRDIKPSNVWLDLAPDGTMRRARILDFGLVRAPGDAILTGAGDVLGTPAYMSVEQARGQLVDFRTDLFSLGTVLYEAATGRRAFSGSTPYAILAVLATQTPPAPIQVNPALAPALSELIVKLMSKTPAGRPQSAQRVAEELARIAAAVAPPLPTAPGSRPVLPPVAASPGSRPVPPLLPTGSASMPALVETDSVVALPTLTTVPEPAPAPEPLLLEPESLSLEPEPDHAHAPREPRSRRRLIAIAAAVAAGFLLVGLVIALAGKGRKGEEVVKKEGESDLGGKGETGGTGGEPFIPPTSIPPPEGERGLPSDPARKLGAWIHSQGWPQTLSVWNGAWVGRLLDPTEVLPGGRWVTTAAELTFDAKRPMTDEDVRWFENPSLVIFSLGLRGESVTNDRLDKLTRLPFAQKLNQIALRGTAVTDEGVMFLARCKNIQLIDLANANVTHAGVRKLADALPATCSIIKPLKLDGSKP